MTGVITQTRSALWRHRPPARSLRRAAAVDRWRRTEASFGSKARDVWRWAWRSANHGTRPFIWITTATLIPLLPQFPFHWSLRHFDGTEQADDARTFLQTLWQVDAAAIALSLAVVLFAFESVREAKARGSLVWFARETRLTYVLAIGIAAIFNIAAVLLGMGAGAPGGWAATWTCIVSGLALASLPFLLQRSLSAMGQTRLVARRLEQTRTATLAAAEEDIFRRIAMLILSERAQEAGVELRGPFFSEPEQGEHHIYADKSGVVADVRLRKLRTLRSRREDEPVARLLVDFNSPVNADTPVLILRDDATRRQRRAARRLFRIKRAEQRRLALREEFDWLHESALQAIRGGLPKTYENITDEYVEALTALPAAWKRIGEDFNSGAAGGLGLFEPMPLDWLEENMWNELREAFRGEHREVAYRAMVLPYRVALRAIDLNAEALFKRMLGLFIAIYREAKNAPDPDIQRLVHGRCISMPLEITKAHLAYPLSGKNVSDDQREQLKRFLEYAQVNLAELAKTAMDEDPTDVATLGSINSGWTEIFQHWLPEHDPPHEFELTHARSTFGADHPTTRAIEERARRRDQLAELKEDVVLWRDALRFGLAFWAFRRLTTKKAAEWLGPMNEFRQYFGSIQALTRAMERTVGDGEGQPWFSWLLHDTFGSSAGPSVDWEMLRAYFAIAPFLVQPTLPAPTIKRPPFLDHQMREAKQLRNGVVQNEDLWALLEPPAEAARRHAVVWRALRRSA